MNKRSDRVTGAIYILISAFAYGTQTILGKYAYASGLTPESLLMLRFIFTVAILTPYLGLSRNAPIIDKSPLVLFQALLFITEGLFFFYSLQYLSASITVVVFFSHPVLVAIAGVIIFKEKLQPQFILGLCCAIAGVTLVSGVLEVTIHLSVIGMIFIIISAILYTIYSLISQKNVRTVSPLTITNTLASGSIVILLLLFHDLSFLKSVTVEQSLIALAMTVFNTIISVIFFLKGVQKIGASRATLLGTLEPVLAMMLAFFLLGETLTPLQLLGAMLVFVSMFLALYPSKAVIPSSINNSNS